MEKQCCNKISNKNDEEIKASCVDCINHLASLAESVGYDKENWVQEAIDDIKLDKDFYCVSMKKLKEIVILLMSRSNSLELELNNLLNDIRYALHDIQAPVRSIRGFSNMLIENSLDRKESDDLLNRINKSAITVTEMLKDMKDIMILGKSRPYLYEIIDFKNIIKDLKENLLHALIQETNAEIIINTKNMPQIKSDKLRWTRVFQNLISNSIKYNKSKKPKINIWFENNQIFIQDNGIGIPKDKWDTVFDMFVRLSDRQNLSEGTGAGLFMCRKFLRMDGFNIYIHQSDDNGTIFIISKN